MTLTFLAAMNVTMTVTIYVEASCGNAKHKKSIFRFIILLGNNIIHYKSKKQPLVTPSSTESKFVAGESLLRDLKWIRSILRELKLPLECLVIYSDNQACIRIAKAAEGLGRTRHLDVKY